MASILVAAKVLTQADRAALAVYAQAYGRLVEAELALREKGPVVKSPSGYPVLNPYLSVANKAIEQIKTFACEFGLTPASRVRLQVPEVEKEDDAEEAMFG